MLVFSLLILGWKLTRRWRHSTTPSRGLEVIGKCYLRPKMNAICWNATWNQKIFAGDQKAETAAIAELAITIKADSPDLGEKVDQLQKQDKVFRDLQTQQVLFECPCFAFGTLKRELDCFVLFKTQHIYSHIFFLGRPCWETCFGEDRKAAIHWPGPFFIDAVILNSCYQENGVSRRKEEALDRINQILKAFWMATLGG